MKIQNRIAMTFRLNRCRIAAPLSGRQDGNLLIYVIVVMMLFAALGVALVSIYTTSNLVAVTGDDARQAGYLAESGIRYAVGELKKSYTRAVIRTLNDTTYTLSDGDSFTVNVFPKWFQAAGSVSVTTGETIDLNVPDDATIPDGFKIATGVYLVNINSLHDAIAFGGDKTLFIAEVNADSVVVDPDTRHTLRVEVKDGFKVSANQPICMALYPNAAYPTPGPTAIAVDGSADLVVGLDDPEIAESVFHEDGGTFYVLDPGTGVRRIYSYDSYTTASPVTLKNIRGLVALSIDPARDLIIFSDKNHTVTGRGRTGPSSSQATVSRKIDVLTNTSAPPVWAPETAEETPADINIASLLATAAVPAASTSGSVEIDTANQQIKLGLGVASAASAVWYGGTLDVGGVSGNFCSAGKCRFEYGMRAYFTVNYNGIGEGFTFALMNGADNTSESIGGAFGLLGYAGTGAGGSILQPKMALEFDTYINTSRNDPGSSNKDYLNFDFWGVDNGNRDDDNVHDTWASISTFSGTVDSTPFVESLAPNVGKILVASDSDTLARGYLHRFTANGATEKTFDLTVQTDSAPVADDSGQVWIGTNDTYMSPVDPTLSYWVTSKWQNVGGDPRTTPFIDPATGWLFYGSDYTGSKGPDQDHCNFCAFDLSGNFQWGFNSEDYIRGSPTVKDGYVYFGGDKEGSGAAGAVWKYNATAPATSAWSSPYVTGSDVRVRPAVSSSGVVYFGTNDNDSYFHAVNPNKTVRWKYDTGLVTINSSAALDETRNRVYFGTAQIKDGPYDGKVYALNADTGALVWSYQTGGAIYSSPVVGSDGAVIIGSDDNFLYAFEPDGTLRWKLDLKGDVRSSPALSLNDKVAYVASNVASDISRLFAVPVSGNPWQFKTWDAIDGYYPYQTYDAGGANNLPTDALAADNPISNANNWLNSGPWAVRIEVDRSQTANSKGTYDYTIRSWIRQCKLDPGDCSEITGSYFSDTRIAYEAKPPQMRQSFELSAADHDKFATYYNGFTQSSGGSAQQTLTLRNIRIGFRRPGDYTVTTDPRW